jgi:adenosine deaminase
VVRVEQEADALVVGAGGRLADDRDLLLLLRLEHLRQAEHARREHRSDRAAPEPVDRPLERLGVDVAGRVEVHLLDVLEMLVATVAVVGLVVHGPQATPRRGRYVLGMRDLAALPKADLHVHLDACMRPSTLRELAARDDVPVPDVSGYGDFSKFAGVYLAACDVVRSDDDLRRLVRETIEDAASHGATWIEPQFYPPDHDTRLGPDEHQVEVVLDEAAVAGARVGVGFGLVLAADRTRDLDAARALARLAAGHAGRGVVGFGLANDEAHFPPEPFADAFAIAREAGLLSVPHAGELAGQLSIVGALDALHADRIGHGVRAIEDAALVRRLADTGVCCDVCPTSNVMLSVVPSLEAHPLGAMLDAGIRCSVGADDPLLFETNVLHEYEQCRDVLGFDDERLAAIARTSFEASAAPAEVVKDALTRIDAWLAS